MNVPLEVLHTSTVELRQSLYRHSGGLVTLLFCLLAISFLPAAAAETLVSTPGTVDFGIVKLGTDLKEQVELNNTGSGELEIQISAQGELFGVDPDTLLLPAGESRSIAVQFSGFAIGAHTGRLSIQTKAFSKEDPLVIPLSALVEKPALQLNPETGLDFDYVALGERAAQTLVATNTGDTDLGVESHPESDEAYADPSSFSLQPEADRRLRRTGGPKRTTLSIPDSGEQRFRAEKFNLRLTEKGVRRECGSLSPHATIGCPRAANIPGARGGGMEVGVRGQTTGLFSVRATSPELHR